MIDNSDNIELLGNLIISCRHDLEFTMFRIPTMHGFHIICNGFDTRQFSLLLEDNKLGTVDVHKNNFILLYYK